MTVFDKVVFQARMARKAAIASIPGALRTLDRADESPEDEPPPPQGPFGPEVEFTSCPWYNDLPMFFNSHRIGRSAVRLRQDSEPPLPVDVHRCKSDGNTDLEKIRVEGKLVPVVLHYPNCDYALWRSRCGRLGADDPTLSAPARRLCRKLVRRSGAAAGDAEAEEALERFYRTFIMNREFGELSVYASHGMICRTRAVRAMLGLQLEAPIAAPEEVAQPWCYAASACAGNIQPQPVAPVLTSASRWCGRRRRHTGRLPVVVDHGGRAVFSEAAPAVPTPVLPRRNYGGAFSRLGALAAPPSGPPDPSSVSARWMALPSM